MPETTFHTTFSTSHFWLSRAKNGSERGLRSAMSYRFGFNGKENDNEVKGTGNQQDYGMRIYDIRLCRFFSIDPIAKDYPDLTPFQFASNSPIKNVDLDGLEANSSDQAKDEKAKQNANISQKPEMFNLDKTTNGEEIYNQVMKVMNYVIPTTDDGSFKVSDYFTYSQGNTYVAGYSIKTNGTEIKNISISITFNSIDEIFSVKNITINKSMITTLLDEVQISNDQQTNNQNIQNSKASNSMNILTLTFDGSAGGAIQISGINTYQGTATDVVQLKLLSIEGSRMIGWISSQLNAGLLTRDKYLKWREVYGLSNSSSSIPQNFRLPNGLQYTYPYGQ